MEIDPISGPKEDPCFEEGEGRKRKELDMDGWSKGGGWWEVG